MSVRAFNEDIIPDQKAEVRGNGKGWPQWGGGFTWWGDFLVIEVRGCMGIVSRIV